MGAVGLSLAGAPGASGADARRAERVAELRRRVAEMPAGRGAGGGVAVEAAPPEARDDGPVLAPPAPSSRGGVALPRALRGLGSGGALPAGRVVAAAGGAGLVVGLVAGATAAGSACAVVGHPGLGLAAVAEQGGDLSLLALVPDPGPDPGAVVSVLLDGMDLVLVDDAACAVTPSRARVLAGRARAAGAVLVVGPAWPGADLRLAAGPCRYAGAARGYGRLRSVARPVSGTWRSGASGSVEWSVGRCGRVGGPVATGDASTAVEERAV